MTDSDRQLRGEMAELVAVIEQVAADLSLAEEPAGFVAALESGGDSE